METDGRKPEMKHSSAASRFMLSSLLAVAVVVFAQTCVTDVCQATSGDPPADTDHVVGDTVARGIEFVLKPAHAMLSNAWFRVFTPSEPQHRTAVILHEFPARNQVQPPQQHGTRR